MIACGRPPCLGSYSASAQYEWADRPANLTLNEFLDLWFNTQLACPESEALNSFNLVSFHPASGPGEALVVIVQTWRDERLSESDLRREIRKAADADLYRFHAMFGLAVLTKPWSSRDVLAATSSSSRRQPKVALMFM